MQAELKDEIETRLGNLEGSMRRWRARAIIAGAALVAAGILGATPSYDGTSTARRFDVVDDDGKVRVSLGANTGGCFLLFKDADGKVRTQLTLQSDGTTGLSLKDEKAVDRLSLSLQADGNNSLSFRGENKKATQSIGGRPDGDMLGNRVAACEAAFDIGERECMFRVHVCDCPLHGTTFARRRQHALSAAMRTTLPLQRTIEL